MKHMKLINLIGIFVFAMLAAFGVVTISPRDMMFGLLGVVTFDQTVGTKAAAQGGISAVGRVFQLMARITIPLTGVTNDIVKALAVKAGTKVRW